MSARLRLPRRSCQLLLFGPPWAHLVLKGGFVQCFERREQFRRSVFVLWPPTEMTHFRRWPQKKTQTYKKYLEHFRSFCSHSELPTKMTYGNSFIFVFLLYHSGWPNSRKPAHLLYSAEVVRWVLVKAGFVYFLFFRNGKRDKVQPLVDEL